MTQCRSYSKSGIFKEKSMKILYSDKHIVVCVKPVGLDSEHALPEALQTALGGEIFPIHRLDQNVGGVMVFARTKFAAAQLSRAVQEGSMVKEYIAMVHGTPESAGDWTDFLFKDSRKNKVFAVKKERKGVKLARLEFLRLTDVDPATVRIRLYTGRSHQIRVQFSSRGFPLVGDHKYGAWDELTAPRLFSCRIRFPFGGKEHCYSDLPEWANDPNYLV